MRGKFNLQHDAPEVLAALREFEEETDATPTPEALDLRQRMEAGEFRKAAIIRRYGRDFWERLQRPKEQR